jgi:hypothetical protein
MSKFALQKKITIIYSQKKLSYRAGPVLLFPCNDITGSQRETNNDMIRTTSGI